MRAVRLLPAVVAVLCVLAWMPWIMGVPGVDGTDYARGWTIGLYSILIYPFAILLIALLSFTLRRMGAAEVMPTGTLRFLALAAFLAAQVVAWSILT